jgi:hypothetical protein
MMASWQMDCGVGQSVFSGKISTARISAEDIEQHTSGSWDPCRSVSQHGQKGKKSVPLIQILLALIVVGVLLWLVNRFIPMAGSIKSILNAVVVICVVLWLLNVFGLFHSLSRIRVG